MSPSNLGCAYRRLWARGWSVAVLLLAAGHAGASVTYSYVGNDFTSVSSPYTVADRVTGSLTLAQALSPGLTSFTIVTPLSFSFSDGPETITSGTPGAGSEFFFKTDALGDVTAWGATVDVGSVAQFSISTVDGPGVYGVFDLAEHGGGTEEGEVQNLPGIWTLSELPEAHTVRLLLAGLLVLIMSARRLRGHDKSS